MFIKYIFTYKLQILWRNYPPAEKYPFKYYLNGTFQAVVSFLDLLFPFSRIRMEDGFFEHLRPKSLFKYYKKIK